MLRACRALGRIIFGHGAIASREHGWRDLRTYPQQVPGMHAGHWLKRLWERVKLEMEDPQVRRERARRDALTRERRATRRSLVLLMKQMSPQQRREFREHRYFHVIGGSSGERYRIRVGTIANIDAMRADGTVKHRLCARPIDDVPVYDVMAAQLLHLQDPASEPHFLLQANVQPTLTDDRPLYRTSCAT